MKLIKFNKKIFLIICLLLSLTLFITGCKKKDKNPSEVKEPVITANLVTDGKLYPGDEGKINVTIENLENTSYIFSYEDNGIISVDKDGNLTAIRS